MHQLVDGILLSNCGVGNYGANEEKRVSVTRIAISSLVAQTISRTRHQQSGANYQCLAADERDGCTHLAWPTHQKQTSMVNLHPEYVVDDEDNKKAMILPMDEWEKVMEELKELEDKRLYDAAETGNEESVPVEQAVAEIE
jgi:hypothetical protein